MMCAVTYHEAILTTREIAETCHYGKGRSRNRYAIPVAGALALPEITLPIPPYVLGIWLGDGHSTSTRITVHKDDLEIADHLRARGVEDAVSLSMRLRELGLIKSRRTPTTGKHIPRVYLRASAQQRFALLQGLMDSDGHIGTRGRCELTTVLPRLAEGFGELLASLGIKYTVKAKLPYALVDGVRHPSCPALLIHGL